VTILKVGLFGMVVCALLACSTKPTELSYSQKKEFALMEHCDKAAGEAFDKQGAPNRPYSRKYFACMRAHGDKSTLKVKYAIP
jgi:hypothetical protein